MLRRKLIVAAIVSASMIGSSTAAVAATPAPAPTTSAWMTLSMLTPSGAAVLGSTGVAAAQPDTLPPPPPPEPRTYTGPGTPPIPVMILWLAVLGTMVYIATKNNHHHPAPNSPA